MPAVVDLRAILDNPAVTAFDEAVDRVVERGRGNPVVDAVMYTASSAGDFSLVWHAIAAVRALTGGPGGARAAARLSTTLLVESAVVNVLLKSATRRDRPEPVASDHQLRRPITSSFPSGHASAAACAAVLLVDDTGDWSPWVPLALVVGSSRLHVRIHHASDVLAGAVVGALIGSIARRVRPVR